MYNVYIRELDGVFKYSLSTLYVRLIVCTILNLVYSKEHIFVLKSIYIYIIYIIWYYRSKTFYNDLWQFVIVMYNIMLTLILSSKLKYNKIKIKIKLKEKNKLK